MSMQLSSKRASIEGKYKQILTHIKVKEGLRSPRNEINCSFSFNKRESVNPSYHKVQRTNCRFSLILSNRYNKAVRLPVELRRRNRVSLDAKLSSREVPSVIRHKAEYTNLNESLEVPMASQKLCHFLNPISQKFPPPRTLRKTILAARKS